MEQHRLAAPGRVEDQVERGRERAAAGLIGYELPIHLHHDLDQCVLVEELGVRAGAHQLDEQGLGDVRRGQVRARAGPRTRTATGRLRFAAQVDHHGDAETAQNVEIRLGRVGQRL